MSLYEEAEALIQSDDADKVRDGLERLRRHAAAHPADAEAWFQYGGGLDSSGDEAAAIVAYDRVFELGLDRLDDADRPRIYVQAGSTLRNLGRLDEARALLEQRCDQFPKRVPGARRGERGPGPPGDRPAVRGCPRRGRG